MKLLYYYYCLNDHQILVYQFWTNNGGNVLLMGLGRLPLLLLWFFRIQACQMKLGQENACVQHQKKYFVYLHQHLHVR